MLTRYDRSTYILKRNKLLPKIYEERNKERSDHMHEERYHEEIECPNEILVQSVSREAALFTCEYCLGEIDSCPECDGTGLAVFRY